MDARLLRSALLVAVLASLGANYRTQNFVITASTPDLAREVGEYAEHYRRQLAIEWLGEELPPWPEPCPITAHAAPHLGAGGATSFAFDRNRPFGWTMNIQGSRERLLDSVLPHEVTHTIFATHFGRPLPRWADEGACTTVEHQVERQKQHDMLYEFLTTGRGIAFNKMFQMREYPPDMLPLYSQGYSLARFLIEQGGKQKFIRFVGDGMARNNWNAATQEYYGFESLSDLQVTWLDWVRQGCPALAGPLRAAPGAGATSPIAVASAGASSVPSAGTTRTGFVGESWYARQRDASRAAPSADAGSATPVQAVTRPQEIGRPGQIIIEPTSSPGRIVPAGAPAAHASPAGPGLPVWR